MSHIFTPNDEKQLSGFRHKFGTEKYEKDYLTDRDELFSNFMQEPRFKKLETRVQTSGNTKRSQNYTGPGHTQRTGMSISRIDKFNETKSHVNLSNRRLTKQSVPSLSQHLQNGLQPLPKWLTDRKEFKDLQQTKYFDIKLKIVSICEQDSFKRDDQQKTLVALYLQKLSLFKLMPFELLFELGGRLQSKKTMYSVGDVLCKQGDPGDCMFIIFKGEISVEIFGNIVKVFGENEHLGRIALETDAPRNATLICSKESYILTLSRWDYQQCLHNIFKIERPKWKQFADQILFLRNFNPAKIAKMCQEFRGKFMSTKDCLYKVGDPIDNVYIVKNGTLVKTVVVDIEDTNRWPIASKQWVSKTITTRLQIPLKYGPQSLLGFYEIVTQDTLGMQARTETIDALEDSFVLYISRTKFIEIFDQDDQKRFKEYHAKMHPTNFEALIDKVRVEDSVKKQEFNVIKSAFMDSLSGISKSQVEQKQKKYEIVMRTAQKRLEEYKKSKHVLKVEKRSKIIASYYE